MASIRELRGRIKSVGNIKQITRAMEMVASTKLRRFQDRAVASRPYSQEIAWLVARLSSMLGDTVADEPLFNVGAGERTLVLLISSDRGLCGAYNTNLFRSVEEWIAGHGGADRTDFFVYGRKGAQYLTKRGYNVKQFIAYMHDTHPDAAQQIREAKKDIPAEVKALLDEAAKSVKAQIA